MTTVSIVCVDPTGSRFNKTVSAKILQHLAVHLADGVKTLDGKPSYSITQVQSGLKASPFFFDSEESALNTARAMNALPIDWSARSFGERRDHIKRAVIAISDLCGGYLVDAVMDRAPAGNA